MTSTNNGFNIPGCNLSQDEILDRIVVCHQDSAHGTTLLQTTKQVVEELCDETSFHVMKQPPRIC